MRNIGNYIITFLIFGGFAYVILPMFRKNMTTYQRMLKAGWAALVFTIVKAILDFLPPF